MTAPDLLYMSKDIDIDLTIKLFLLLFLFLYLCIMIFFSKLKDNDRYYEMFFKIFFMKIPGFMLFFYFPLNALFLYREVEAITLFTYIASFYGIYTTLMIVLVLAFGTDFLLNMVGIDIGNFKKLKRSGKKVRL